MRPISIRTTTFVALLSLFVFSTPTSSQSPTRRVGQLEVEDISNREVVAREALVRLTGPLQRAQLAQIASAADLDVLEAVGRSGVYRVRSRSIRAAALLSALSNITGIAYAEPNFVVRALAEPNDPLFPSLWGLRSIHAPESWDITFGSASNVVAIVDTGIDYNHPDLQANVWSAPSAFTVTIGGMSITCGAGTHGFNAIQRTCDPMDDHNHGTHVAGTIGAEGSNGLGVTGVNWTASMMGLKFLDASGSGTVSDAIDAIEFAIQAKQAFAGTGAANVRILSNSWGGGDFSQALLDQINAANDQDMLFVAAAGNNGLPNDVIPLYPASYSAPNMVAVEATTSTDGRASFSNFGATTVHLGAPGVDIVSSIRGGGYASFSGTSMATPHVSGAGALVLSHCPLSTADLKATLLDSADVVPSLVGTTITGGRLNVDTAIRSCSGPPASVSSLRAAGGDMQVRLDWPAASGATRYNVKRSMTPGGPYSLAASNVKGVQYIDGGLVNGTTYYYVVSAANMIGSSADSPEASATPAIPADLVVSSFIVPNNATPGVPFSVNVTTKNQGTGLAAPTRTKFFISIDTVIEPTDVQLVEEQVVPIANPGASFAASIPLSIPEQLPTGTYYLIAKADANDILFESQEGNNLRLRQIYVGSDLVVTALTGPSGATPGASMTLNYSVANQGGVAAPVSNLRFYWSTNSSLEAADTLLSNENVGPIAPAGVASGQTTFIVPAGAAIGTYYVIAEADALDAISEIRETNNTATYLVRIGGDLVVPAFTAPAAFGAGASIVIGDTTRNDGGSPVGGSTTHFYLSTDAVLSAGDAYLGARPVGVLGSGESSAGSTTVLIPSGTLAGSYSLFAKADGGNSVSESQETNNTAVKSIKVGPDLTADIDVVTTPVVAGSQTRVTESVTNKGGANAGPSTVGYYLSIDPTLDATDVRLPESRTILSLAVGVKSLATTWVTIPLGTVARTYYLIVKADADGSVGESSETNNTWPRMFRVD
ncbi:MAG: S8 family serine peptidase [Vicinamibacterales bacterium]|nr:S8 family serine peptidase [Vicinamibacterales bacterium]